MPLLGINQAAVLCACVCLHDTNAWNSLIRFPSPGQNSRDFTGIIFRCILMKEQFCFLINMSLKYVHRRPIDNYTVLAYFMAWCRSAAKPLYESMMVRSLTHICVTRPQWVKLLQRQLYCMKDRPDDNAIAIRDSLPWVSAYFMHYKANMFS